MITLPPEPITTDKQPTAATAAQVVNSRFVITNNQTEYESSQVWVSFNGVFTNTGQNQTIGTETITVFGQEVWASYPLSDLQTVVNDLPFYGSAPVYTFSFNNFFNISSSKDLEHNTNNGSCISVEIDFKPFFQMLNNFCSAIGLTSLLMFGK